jgi:hypothetical protein
MAELQQVFDQLVQAIHVAIDPQSTSIDRSSANAFIEEIKRKAESDDGRQHALEFAILLLNHHNPSVPARPITAEQVCAHTKQINVHNFGFQLLEIVVKYSWNHMPDASKHELKSLAVSIVCRQQLNQSVLDSIYANRLLKDQFSRFVVELLKRLWPQEWPDFMDVCFAQRQNELVLYIIWRLSEDVCILFSPSNPARRRDINAKLKSLLPNIFQYIAESLSFDNIELTLLAMQCLSTFFEWCPVSAEAISYLCNLLSIELNDMDVFLKVSNTVVDCLLTVLERKNYKPDERKELLVFFAPENYSKLTGFLE